MAEVVSMVSLQEWASSQRPEWVAKAKPKAMGMTELRRPKSQSRKPNKARLSTLETQSRGSQQPKEASASKAG